MVRDGLGVKMWRILGTGLRTAQSWTQEGLVIQLIGWIRRVGARRTWSVLHSLAQRGKASTTTESCAPRVLSGNGYYAVSGVWDERWNRCSALPYACTKHVNIAYLQVEQSRVDYINLLVISGSRQTGLFSNEPMICGGLVLAIEI